MVAVAAYCATSDADIIKQRRNGSKDTMNKIIAANWKMNPGTAAETSALAEGVLNGMTAELRKNTSVILAAPFVYLRDLAMLWERRRERHVVLAAQNMFWAEKGAYTGEISPAMLADSGIRTVIIGHSERRRYGGETDELINQKIIAAFKHKFRVILCVGEQNKDEAFEVLEREITADLAGVGKAQLQNLMIAYEPIWAIGSGAPDTPQDSAQKMLYIRRLIAKKANAKAAFAVPVLYGGSVTEKNARDFLQEEHIDGVLVGGASLKPQSFLAIIAAGAPEAPH